jgi:putative ABC transport system permease protein
VVVTAAGFRGLRLGRTCDVWVPLQVRDPVLMHLLARTTAGAGPRLAQLHAQLLKIGRAHVLWTTTFDDHLVHELFINHVITIVVAGCGLLALVLSTIGVYGMIADAVRRRTAEIGLRVALGARRRAVVALVLKEGLFMTAAGAIVGSTGTVVLASREIVRAQFAVR